MNENKRITNGEAFVESLVRFIDSRAMLMASSDKDGVTSRVLREVLAADRKNLINAVDAMCPAVRLCQ